MYSMESENVRMRSIDFPNRKETHWISWSCLNDSKLIHGYTNVLTIKEFWYNQSLPSDEKVKKHRFPKVVKVLQNFSKIFKKK